MPATILSITADEDLIRRAAHAAEQQKTDLHSLVLSYLEAVASGDDTINEEALPPITRRALGMFKGIPNRPYKELLAEALAEKYGFED